MSTPSSTLQPGSCESQPPDGEPKPKKKKKKKAKAGEDAAGEKVQDICVDVAGALESSAGDGVTSPPEKKSKKKPKEKEAKEAKEPKAPKTPKTPKTPKESKDKKIKVTTPKPKSTKKSR